MRCLPRKRIFYLEVFKNYFKSFSMDLGFGGKTDISGNNFHKEIKSWNEWKECIGNLIAYNDICQKEKLQIYFFGNHTNKETIINIIKHCKYKIEIYEIIDYLQKVEIKNLKNNKIINSINIIDNLKISS